MAEADHDVSHGGHLAYASAKFAGDPRDGFWYMTVKFGSKQEIDALIRVLTALRDDPETQRYHVHLQDHRFAYEHPEHTHVPRGRGGGAVLTRGPT